jgi:hypothetical protein
LLERYLYPNHGIRLHVIQAGPEDGPPCDQVELTLFEDATHCVQHEKARAVSQALINFFNPRADRLDANQQPG